MSLWKCLQNNIHDDMDGVAILLLPAGCVPITQAEADALRAPPPLTAQQQRDAIQAQINALEQAAIENRKWREYSIEQMESAAIAFGAAQVPAYSAAESLAYAYATNIAYRKTKDLDMQITALRTQKDAIV